MDNGGNNLANKLSGLALNDPDNNDSLFQVMKAVEAAEVTIKQQGMYRLTAWVLPLKWKTYGVLKEAHSRIVQDFHFCVSAENNLDADASPTFVQLMISPAQQITPEYNMIRHNWTLNLS